MSLPSSGPKNKPSKKQTGGKLFYGPENGDIFFRKNRLILTDYTAPYTRRWKPS
jgi:hypothetical protein